MNTDLMFSSKSDEWCTPLPLFKRLNKKFKFTLDPAATKENALCDYFYTKEDDGLLQSWDGRVFCNPPYGREISKWVAKASMSAELGESELIVMLLPARTDTKWFHSYIWDEFKNKPKVGVQVKFIKGRLKFNGHKNPAPFPSMLVLFNPRRS